VFEASGAGTNFKVAGNQFGAKVGGGHGKNFFLVVPLHFFAVKAQLVVLVSAFVLL